MEPKWLYWAKQLQAIAQTGLTYSKDIYDIERFAHIQDLSIEIIAEHSGIKQQEVKALFANEKGYATPKVDIRAVIFRDKKILMVKENSDGNWSLPGGWGDVGLSPSQVAIKEVKEEAGFDVKANRLLAVFDTSHHPHPPSLYHVYKIFIQCDIIGGQPIRGIETEEVDFFAEDEIPSLSEARNTKSQIEKAFQYLANPELPVYFD
ncbi:MULTISPECIES: NUDIX hydrolase [Bacillus]|uniref:NUDIX hydrolase n=1 Tax=Bacillus TaxID=1386 RepID=UPI0002F4138B|nr:MULTISPECIES: NUDIX hydrolase [Bacillus]